MIDKYHNSSYQKTIISIIFLACSSAWSPLSVHQVITSSIFLFYNKWGDILQRCSKIGKLVVRALVMARWYVGTTA